MSKNQNTTPINKAKSYFHDRMVQILHIFSKVTVLRIIYQGKSYYQICIDVTRQFSHSEKRLES